MFGAAAFFDATPADADRMLDTLLEHGINHIDTAADYGKSEELLGRWIGRHRESFFLATKTAARDSIGAKESIERSLERMKVDHVDLLQLHCLIEPGGWEQAMGADGALEAVMESRERGLTRFVGVTAHETVAPSVLMRSLEHFDFDSVLLPCNYPLMQNPDYAAGFETLVALCAERGVAVQTIKAVARRLRRDESKTYSTWYEPLQRQEDVDCAVHWVLARPAVFLNSAGDVKIAPRIFDAAERFDPSTSPSDGEMRRFAADAGLEPLFPIPEETP
ncbi:MAG: aldo/keto reductase [Candidatus Bipolaricaulota bacterium]|nr:MAG: aldo/keto reductase [Candidatus Bipolaricaulota bacterium]